MGEYRVIYADCPWAYRGRNLAGCIDQSDSKAYNTMTPTELCAMRPPVAADGPAVLFAWATAPKLGEAFAVIESWGFEFAGVFATWIKTTSKSGKRAFGIGWYTASNVELLLVAAREMDGCGATNVVVESPLTSHSKKPDVFRSMVVDFADANGLGRPIEMFARGGSDDRLDYHGDQAETGPQRIAGSTRSRTRAELKFGFKRLRTEPAQRCPVSESTRVVVCTSETIDGIEIDCRRPLMVICGTDHSGLRGAIQKLWNAGLDYKTIVFVSADATTFWLAATSKTFVLTETKLKHRSQILRADETAEQACRETFAGVQSLVSAATATATAMGT